jgi:hypothetical protein
MHRTLRVVIHDRQYWDNFRFFYVLVRRRSLETFFFCWLPPSLSLWIEFHVHVRSFHNSTYGLTEVLSLVSTPVTMSGRSCFRPATLWSRFLRTMPTQLQLRTPRMEQTQTRSHAAILGWREKRGRMQSDYSLAKISFRDPMFLGITKSLPYLLLFPWLCFTFNWSFWLLRRSISNDVWDICRLLLRECWTSSEQLSVRK